MTPDPKPEKPYRSKKYLAFIRKIPCDICWQHSEPHHIRRSYWGAGGNQKPHDYVAVPRCRKHHSTDYEDGVEIEIINNLIQYLRCHNKEREIIKALMGIAKTI